MRNRVAYSVAFLLLVVAAWSCTKEEKPYVPLKVCSDISNKKQAIDSYLQGSWKWLEDKSYEYGGCVIYNTPKTAGFLEVVTINSNQIEFMRHGKGGIETTIFDYTIRREGESTFMPSDSLWTLTIFDQNQKPLNYWRVYICSTHLILQNAFRGEYYPDRTYKKL